MRAYELETEFGAELGEAEDGEGEYGEFEDTEYGEVGEYELGEYQDEYGETEFAEADYGEFGAAEYEEEYGELGELDEAEELELELYSEEQEFAGEVESLLSEDEEDELAAELLELTDEGDLEDFFLPLLGAAATALAPLAKRAIPTVARWGGKALGKVKSLLTKTPRMARAARKRPRRGRARPPARRARVTARRARPTRRRVQPRTRTQQPRARRAQPRRQPRSAGARGHYLTPRAGAGRVQPRRRGDGDFDRSRAARREERWKGRQSAIGGMPITLGTSLLAGSIAPHIPDLLQALQGLLDEQELEGLSQEEATFEGARRLVRMATTAADNVSRAAQVADPDTVARAAFLAATREHAPAVYPAFRHFTRPDVWNEFERAPVDGVPLPAMGRRQTGRWMRRGNRIVITGL